MTYTDMTYTDMTKNTGDYNTGEGQNFILAEEPQHDIQSCYIYYIWDAQSDEVSWSDDAAEALERVPVQLPCTPKDLNLMVNPQDLPERMARVNELRTSRRPMQVAALTYRLKLGNGYHVEAQETLCVLETREGIKLQGNISFEKPVNKVLPQTQAVSEISHHQTSSPISLGGQPGCEGFKGRITMEQALQEALGSPCLLQPKCGFFLAVGIDRLSVLNNAMGACAVDDIIEKAHERLTMRFGSLAQITRINGDVFGVLCRQGSMSDMALTAQKIITGFRDEAIMSAQGPVRIGVSVGGAYYDHETCVSADIIAQAESALNQAKERGRGCFAAYESARNYAGSAADLLRSGEEFLKALEENRVKLAYQPIMDSKIGKTSFHECLIRMVDRQGGMVNAAHFVPAVETLGMVRMLDQCAMKLAIEELIKFPDVRLSVNVSKYSFADRDWLRGVVLALRDRPHAAKRLVIEITESVAMQDTKQADMFIKTLKELGCRIALDDFGAGHTGFSQIQQLDVDMIKIDKGFVRGMGEEKNKVFLQAMQMLADGAELETVGEGAETSEEAAQLTDTGINHIQGYLYGVPSLERVWLPENHIQRKPALNIREMDEKTQSDFKRQAAAV